MQNARRRWSGRAVQYGARMGICPMCFGEGGGVSEIIRKHQRKHAVSNNFRAALHVDAAPCFARRQAARLHSYKNSVGRRDHAARLSAAGGLVSAVFCVDGFGADLPRAAGARDRRVCTRRRYRHSGPCIVTAAHRIAGPVIHGGQPHRRGRHDCGRDSVHARRPMATRCWSAASRRLRSIPI